MVTIRKGNKRLVVAKGAYKEHFKHAGWSLDHSPKKADKLSKHEKENATEAKIAQEENDQDDNEVENEEETEDESEDEETEDENLSEKPLSEMNFEELQAYAEQLEINTEGMRSKKEIRQAIKDAR